LLLSLTSGCLIPDPPSKQGFTERAPAALEKRGISYGNKGVQKLDLFRPGGAGPFPVIIWVHGGGWNSGHRSSIANFVKRQWSRGYAVASIDYHLSTPKKASFLPAVQDVKTAVRWAKANAAKYRLRADKIILAGASAGGHLAAFAGVTPGMFEPTCMPAELRKQDSTVAGIANFVGPADLNKLVNETPDGGARCMVRNLTRQFIGCPVPPGTRACSPTDTSPFRLCDPLALLIASVTTWVDSTDPPVYLGYGGNDPIVKASLHGRRQHDLWVAAKNNTYAAWYDLNETAAHAPYDGNVLNLTYWDAFLDDVVSGNVH
jgi:acetyl esterase/lipase